MKEALSKIKGNKIIKTNFIVKVVNVALMNDQDYIVLDIEENNCTFYKITLIKGEIFPLPKKK